MKLIFIGSGTFAVPSLEKLVGAGHEVTAVFAQPDKPAGRGHAMTMPRTKPAAHGLGIPVHQPPKIRTPDAVELIRGLAPEIIVVVAYGQIIPKSILDISPRGIVNVHGSVLPAYRGAAPIQWAIANGETETGVTTMLMDEGLDTGPVLLVRKHGIGPTDTTASLEPELARLGADLLVETLEALQTGRVTPEPQDEAAASLAPRIKKEDGRVDWSWPASKIDPRIRAFVPWPVAYVESASAPGPVKLYAATPEPRASGLEEAENGTLLSYSGDSVRVACGGGSALAVHEVQAPGRPRMSAAAFARGRRLEPGARFP